MVFRRISIGNMPVSERLKSKDVGSSGRSRDRGHGSQAMGWLAALWQWFPSMKRLLLLLLIVLLGGGIVWDLLLPRSVEINPIPIPPELAEHGYTPEIIARRLSDEMLLIRNQAKINKKPGVTKTVEEEPRYEPPSVMPRFDIKVPGSGI